MGSGASESGVGVWCPSWGLGVRGPLGGRLGAPQMAGGRAASSG